MAFLLFFILGLFTVQLDSLPHETFECTLILPIEENASFRGGQNTMFLFIKKHLHCPANAPKGKVYIQFKVHKNGTLSDFSILRGLSPSCDKEALRVLKMMPKWIPAKLQGKAIDSRYTVPIAFDCQ